MLFVFWILLQLVFSDVNNIDNSPSDINIIVTFEWIVLLFLISNLIYQGTTDKQVPIYFPFIIANLFYILGMCISSPVFTTNLGFHHSNYVPIHNPLLLNSVSYIAFLLYINFKFRKNKITSLNFSRFIYFASIIAVITIIFIKITSDLEIEKIIHFHG